MYIHDGADSVCRVMVALLPPTMRDRRGMTFTKGNLYSTFIRGRQRALSECAAYLPSNQDNLHANVTHFGVKSSDPVHNKYRIMCRAL